MINLYQNGKAQESTLNNYIFVKTTDITFSEMESEDSKIVLNYISRIILVYRSALVINAHFTEKFVLDIMLSNTKLEFSKKWFQIGKEL